MSLPSFAGKGVLTSGRGGRGIRFERKLIAGTSPLSSGERQGSGRLTPAVVAGGGGVPCPSAGITTGFSGEAFCSMTRAAAASGDSIFGARKVCALATPPLPAKACPRWWGLGWTVILPCS